MAFVAALESRRITVTVRQTRGLDASAACGQLRNDFQKTPLIEESPSSSIWKTWADFKVCHRLQASGSIMNLGSIFTHLKSPCYVFQNRDGQPPTTGCNEFFFKVWSNGWSRKCWEFFWSMFLSILKCLRSYFSMW